MIEQSYLNMGKRFQQTFQQRRYVGGRRAHGKTLSITGHWGVEIRTIMRRDSPCPGVANVEKMDYVWEVRTTMWNNGQCSTWLMDTISPPLFIILMFFLKFKHSPTTESSHCTPRDLSRTKENICSYTDLYIRVHSRFIWNTRKLETTLMSFSRWVDKLAISIQWNTTQN